MIRQQSASCYFAECCSCGISLGPRLTAEDLNTAMNENQWFKYNAGSGGTIKNQTICKHCKDAISPPL
jgi:hypothetical protein